MSNDAGKAVLADLLAATDRLHAATIKLMIAEDPDPPEDERVENKFAAVEEAAGALAQASAAMLNARVYQRKQTTE